MENKMNVIAVDYDGTLNTNAGIEKVNELFEDKNNFIVIYTARSNSIRRQTEIELEQFGINYHALVMEKLRADTYVDNKNEGGLRWPKI